MAKRFEEYVLPPHCHVRRITIRGSAMPQPGVHITIQFTETKQDFQLFIPKLEWERLKEVS